MKTRFFLRAAALAASFALTGGAHAALTAYTSQSGFLAVISNPGVDTFTSLSTTALSANPVARTAGSYSYTVTVPASSALGVDTTGDTWLSSNSNDDSIVFSGFSGGVSGVGGNFFGTDINGAFLAGSVTLTAVDSLGASLTQTITGATTASFLGFKSTGTIVSLTLTAVQPTLDFLWPTADNLTVGVSAVPEPETYALMLAGLAIVGAASRRRRG